MASGWDNAGRLVRRRAASALPAPWRTGGCAASDNAAMALSTEFTRLFGVAHPIALAPMGGSAGGHPHLERWRGREAELVGDPQARLDYENDVERGLIPPSPVWAGEGIDLITDVPSAADLVALLAAQAATALARAGQG